MVRFPHKHDDRLPDETRHDEHIIIVFTNNGFGFQLFQQVDEKVGRQNILMDLPSIRTGYLLILPLDMRCIILQGGLLRSLVQPEHAYQIETCRY